MLERDRRTYHVHLLMPLNRLWQGSNEFHKINHIECLELLFYHFNVWKPEEYLYGKWTKKDPPGQFFRKLLATILSSMDLFVMLYKTNLNAKRIKCIILKGFNY